METKQRIENLFTLLRNKAHLLIAEAGSYNSLVNFLIGYELGLSQGRDEAIPSFNDWLMEKEGRRFSANWPSYLLQQNNNIEEDAKKRLLDDFEAYLMQVLIP